MSPSRTPDHPDLLEARRRWRAGDRDAALDAFALACRAQPGDLRVRLEYAAALGRRYRAAEACALLADARPTAARNPDIASALAACYAGLSRPHEAISCIEEALESARHPRLLAELGVYYEQVGNFGRASAVLGESVWAAPDRPEPRLLLARVRTHLGELDDAEADLRVVQGVAPAHPPLLTVRCQYQLGVVLDRKGDHRGAIEAVERAKSLQRGAPESVHLARAGMHAHTVLADAHERLDAAVIDEWLSADLPALPGGVRPAHLLGFPRSGTTLLEQPLQAHPGLTVCSERLVFPEEILPHVVGRGTDAAGAIRHASDLSRDRLIALRERYLECGRAECQRDPAGSVLLDKKPANTPLLLALLRVLPESRLLVAVRDPRDVITSCYMTYFPLTDMSACFLTWEGACSLYALVMRIWLRMRDMLPEGSWREVRYEEVCEDVVGEAGRALKFLGVEPDPAVASYLEQTRGAYVHSPTFAEVRRPAHTRAIGRWRRYEEHLAPHLATLAPFAAQLGYAEAT